MKRLIMPLALGTVLAGAVAAFATESPYKPLHVQRAAYHWSFFGYPDPTPTASARAHARRLRHEGLSRSASDCAKYGCLGH